ncbi:MAG TPA: diguanylate cyclase, partial [Humisphaera sp.]
AARGTDDNARQAVRHLADAPPVRHMDLRRMPAMLAHVARTYDRLSGMSVVGTDGRTVWRSDGGPPLDVSDRAWFRRALAGEPAVRESVAAGKATGRPVVVYAAPVRDADDGTVVGVVSVGVELSKLTGQLAPARIGSTGACVLVDESAHVLAHPDAARVARFGELADLPPVRDARDGSPGNRAGGRAARFDDGAGTRWIGYAVPVGNGWTAVGMREEAEVVGLTRRSFGLTAVVAALAVAAAALATWLAVGRWLRPVSALTRAAERLSRGQWGCTVPETGSGELLVLAQAFNRMSRELADAYHTVERRVERAEQRFRDIVHHAIMGIYQTSPQGHYLTANPALARIYGYDSPAELVAALTDIAAQLYVEAGKREEFRAAIERDGSVVDFRARVRRRDGTVRWVSENARVVRDAAGAVVCYEGTVQDITDRLAAEAALAESERFSRSTVDALSARIAILDERGEVISTNRAWRQAGSGGAAEDAGHGGEAPADRAAGSPLIGAAVGTDYLKNCEGVRGLVGLFASQFVGGVHAVLAGHRRRFVVEYGYGPKDDREGGGGRRWFAAHVTRFAGDGPVRVVVAHEDVTERRKAEERLRHDALHDGLTGLPNRAHFEQRVAASLARARAEPDYGFAVLFLDLDRFKVINDSLGHAAGDRLLVVVAERLAGCLRSSDLLAPAADREAARDAAEPAGFMGRLGGDEFTILLDAVRHPDDARRVADRVLAALARPIDFDGTEIVTAASIGIAFGHPAYESPKDLLRDADAAMYRAKQAGRGRHALFDASMREAAVHRLRLETDLRRALDRGELLLVYQPVVCLQTREVAGVEALIRWRHADRGMISPAEFIPAAEE